MLSCQATILLLLRRADSNDGVASYCETIVKGLRARGDRVVIVSGPVTQLYGSHVRHAAITENVNEWVVIDDLISGLPKPSVIKSILAVMRKHSVDLISPQGFSLVPLAFLLSQLANRPVVVNYHPSVQGKAPATTATSRSAKMRFGYKAAAKLFAPHHFIAISKEILTFYRRDCAISDDRVSYIPNGIDLSFFRPPSQTERASARSSLSVPQDALVCILPGRVSFDKGHDIVIDAVRILNGTNPRAHIVCLFPGGGDHVAEIRSYALKSGADPEAFRFLGFLDTNAFRQCYWASDIVLLPSRFEGFGLVVAEGMSCGCVPIRTPSGGAEDQIVEGVTGFLVPFNDPKALAERIATLAQPSAREKMRANAIQHAVRHFNQDAMIEATSNLYRRMATRGRPIPSDA